MMQLDPYPDDMPREYPPAIDLPEKLELRPAQSEWESFESAHNHKIRMEINALKEN